MKRRSSDQSSQPVVIDGYTDLARIGSGGFSVVYRAHEVALNRGVAIKVLNAGLADDRDRRSFERECRAIGQLDHPDIVRVYRSTYTIDDRPCIVMELYDTNFREVLEQNGPLPAPELLDVGVRIAVALHVAHAKDVLHRDVKPHNIFRSRYGDPALGDFGISTVVGDRTHSGPGGLSVAYAAPELLEEGGSGVPSDVYALAATLYHLATGAPPFASKDLKQAVRKILTADPPPIERVDLPAGFERALRAALAKDPTQRPVDALAFAEMLREVQARMGVLQTPIKLELDGPRQTSTATPPRPPNLTTTPDAAPVLTPSIASGDSGDTVVRRQIPKPAAAPPPSGLNRQRRTIAVAAAAVAVIGLVIAAVAISSDADEPSTTPTTAGTAPPVDSFFDVVSPPSEVVVQREDSGAFTIEITPVDGATSYIVTPVGDELEPVTVAADDLPLVINAGSNTNLCVQAQAVGEGGRASREAGPFCAP